MKWHLFTAAMASLVLGAVRTDAVQAQAQGPLCSNTACTGIVNDLFVTVGRTYVRTDQDETGLNCTLHPGGYITLLKTHDNYEAIFSTLLTHYMAKQQIIVRIVEGSQGCEVSYVRALSQ